MSAPRNPLEVVMVIFCLAIVALFHPIAAWREWHEDRNQND